MRSKSAGRRSSDRARIEDVAAACGVSMMTVSRALRGVEGVGADTRARIIRTAARMRYVPNSNARSLVGANSTLVGISLPTFYNDVFADILMGMRGALSAAGFSTVIDTTEYSAGVERAWVERLMSWRPAALILTGIDHAPEVVDMLRRARIPVLEIWDHTPDPIDICVGLDHVEAGRVLGAHVAALGYRRGAYVGTVEGYDIRAGRRLEGLRAAFAAGGLPPLAIERTAPGPAFEAGFRGTAALLDRPGPPPEVVFYLSDHLAFGGLMAVEARGLAVPRDIGIAGFNGLDITHVLPVPLTTLRTPRRQIGVLGARRLLARINGATAGTGVPRSTALPVQVVDGGTTRRR